MDEVLGILEERYNARLMSGNMDGSKSNSVVNWLQSALNNDFSVCNVDDVYAFIYENIWEESLKHQNLERRDLAC